MFLYTVENIAESLQGPCRITEDSGLACHYIWLTNTLGEAGMPCYPSVSHCSTHVREKCVPHIFAFVSNMHSPYVCCVLRLSVWMS